MTPLQERLQNGLAAAYTIDRVLGEGGMAIVFLAKDLRHDRNVALKVLRPDVAREIGAERFLREIRLAAGLSHPHILALYDSGSADDLLYYVMPNMEAQSLRDRLDREKQLSLEDAIRITQEVASALEYAHRQGVVHRDIKPENILFNEGSALVADFGLGKAASEAEQSLTQTGLAMGTPMYMSPEQATGDVQVDGRSDLYSLGCVFYEMLSGEPPFTGPNAQAVITKRFISPVPQVRAVRDVPEAVDTAVSRAMARTPVDRFQSAEEFSQALRLIRTGVGRGPVQAPADAARARASKKSIAVLPLANMSADPENEYFSDGMTEEIINALAGLPEVQVASRTSSFAFKGKEVDVREIGATLGVGSVLEGSVRKIGNRIRVAAQLIDVKNGYQLWSQTYDRQMEDVFAIQDEISRAIVEALKVRLVGGRGALVAPTTENLEAYTLYLKGRFFFNKFTEPDLRKGLDFFERALEQDPAYARAYTGIADCWSTLADDWVLPADAYPRAKAAAERALDIDSSLAEAVTSVGKVLCWYEWDFPGAERELRRAVNLNENYAEAHYVFGSALPAVGKLDEAIEQMREALTLDPLVPHYSRWLGRFLLYAQRYDEAIEQSHKTLELSHTSFHTHLDMGSAYLAMGQADEALRWFQRSQSLPSAVRSYDAHIVRGLAGLMELEEAHAIMERLETEAEQRYVRGEVLAMGYAALAELDRAFGWLDRALEERSAGLIYLHLDPGYDPLREDPRYAEIVRKVGVR